MIKNQKMMHAKKNKMCKEELLKERQKTTIFSSFCDIDVFLQK